ncbi:hypothetical protein ACJJTC_007125 [Scirpophaga incertulas]
MVDIFLACGILTKAEDYHRVCTVCRCACRFTFYLPCLLTKRKFGYNNMRPEFNEESCQCACAGQQATKRQLRCVSMRVRRCRGICRASQFRPRSFINHAFDKHLLSYILYFSLWRSQEPRTGIKLTLSQICTFIPFYPFGGTAAIFYKILRNSTSTREDKNKIAGTRRHKCSESMTPSSPARCLVSCGQNKQLKWYKLKAMTGGTQRAHARKHLI